MATDPTDGATLDEAPTQIMLTFSADQIDVGTAVRVVDAAGQDHADGAPRVDGPTVVQPLTPLAPGTYEVVWRSVSSDGHTLDGAFGFEVAGAAEQPPAEPTPEVTTAAPTEPVTGPTADPTPEPTTTDAPADAGTADGGGGPALPLVLGALGLGVVGAAVALLVRRRRS
nr:copper resistance CopC family protein [Cellulomonas sp. APG4]